MPQALSVRRRTSSLQTMDQLFTRPQPSNLHWTEFQLQAQFFLVVCLQNPVITSEMRCHHFQGERHPSQHLSVPSIETAHWWYWLSKSSLSDSPPIRPAIEYLVTVRMTDNFYFLGNTQSYENEFMSMTLPS